MKKKNYIFQFKQFSVIHEKSAMKVGVDAVLLGSWIDLTDNQRVLDVGTGCGVIALMATQKNNTAFIDAIEIDKNAFIEASQNFANSLWNNRLNAINIDFLEFNSENLYDHIISNPPFFSNSLQSTCQERNLARHTDTLPLKKLIKKSASLLKKDGKFSVILPFSEKNSFIEDCLAQNLFLSRQLKVHTDEKSDAKRILLEFSTKKSDIISQELFIYKADRSDYTSEYKKLTQDFYLNF